MSTGIDLSRAVLTFQRGIELLESDPLREFRHQCEKAKDFTRNLGRAEIYLHAANKWGKSTLGIATDLAMCAGMDELDGVPLPHVPMPARWGLFVTDYKAHRSSTQPIIERLVGRRPHRFERIGQTIVGVLLRPEDWRDDDPQSWSRLTVYSCENPNAGVGARLHGAGFDEPPPMPILQEVRKAGEAAAIYPMSIRATPLRRSQWWPLRADYPDPDINEGRILDGFLRLRGSVYENSALTPRDIRELERKYRNDPLKLARLYGQEINTDGSSPFRLHYAELERWFQAFEAGEVEEWDVPREVPTPEGLAVVTETVQVVVHRKAVPGHVYRVFADPSQGIDDGDHDPGAALVGDMTTGEEVASYHGFIGEYGLGVLCAALSRDYDDAMVDPDVTGGYGEGLLRGLRAAGCRRVVNRSSGRDGLDRTHLGFTIDAAFRMEGVAALNEALLAAEQGSPWLRLRSRWVLADLVDLVMRNDKPVTGNGTHDEGFILAARFAMLKTPERAPWRATPRREPVESPREAGWKALREEMGLPVVRRGRDGSEPGRRMRRMSGPRT